jgi:23S rRNA (guanosine2251-2'-O)-methyltransferase
MTDIILIAHNLRSTHNVGSLLRTAEGLGVTKVYLTGYTPYPAKVGDGRLPHISQKLTSQISKTALGAEKSDFWQHMDDVSDCITITKKSGYTIAAVEQAQNSIALPQYKTPKKIALLVGRETDGIEHEVLKQCDEIIEIPMFGMKESFNVVQAAAMTLYHCRFYPFA